MITKLEGQTTIEKLDNGFIKITLFDSAYWYKNGQRHNEHGPAVIHENGTLEWWLNDRRVSEEEHAFRTSKLWRRLSE